MLRPDYSRSLREVRDLPEDVGRMINYYAYHTPEEELMYLALDLLNMMNAPGPHAISDEPIDNVKINSENIKKVVDYLKLNLKNSFQEFLNSFTLQQIETGMPIYITQPFLEDICELVKIRGLNEPVKMRMLMDNFLLNRGRNERIIKPDQSLLDFYTQFKDFSRFL